MLFPRGLAQKSEKALLAYNYTLPTEENQLAGTLFAFKLYVVIY